MKRFLRIVVWIAGILVILLIIAVVGLKLFFPVEKVKAMAVEEGSKALDREVSVGDLALSFWGGLGVQLSDVSVGNPEGFDGPPFLSAEAVDLKLSLLPLITGSIRVDKLVIERPIITLHKLVDGRTNFAFEVPDSTIPPEMEEMSREMSPEARPAAAAISFDELEINNGRLVYLDDSTGMQADIINMGLLTSLENPGVGKFISYGKLQVDSVRVTIDEPYPVVSLGLTYRVNYDMNSQSLMIERADVELNKIRFKVTGDARSLMDDMVIRTNIKSDRVTVADLLNMLPQSQRDAMKDYQVSGDFQLDADVEYNATSEPKLYYAGTATLSDMVMSSSKIDGELRLGKTLIDVKPDNLRMTIEDGSFAGRPLLGHLVLENFDNPSVSGQLAGGLDLAFVQPFLPAEQKHQLSGQAKFDITFNGLIETPEAMTFSGTAQITSGNYNSPLMPEPINNLTLDAYFDNRLLHVRSLACKFPSGNAEFSGRVNDIVSWMLADSAAAKKIKPQVEGNMKGQLDLAIANRYLPEKGSPSMKGKLDMNITITGRIGDMASFRPRGTMNITGASYTDSLLPEPMENFDAAFRLTPDTIVVSSLNVKFTSSDVSFAGRLANPFPYLLPLEDIDRSKMSKPFFDFTLSAHRFDTDKLFPEAVPGSAADPTSVSADSVSFILLPDVDGRGTFSADTIIYSQVEFTNVTGKIKIYDRRIEAYDAAASVYSGRVSGNTTIDLNDFENPVYSGEFAASQVEADDFVSRFSKFGGHLYGKGDFSGSYNAVGWDPDAFVNSLNMSMDVNIREGKLVTSGGLHTALNGIAQLAKESVAEEQPLKNLVTKMTVKDGRVNTGLLKTKLGNLGDLSVDGWYGFNGALDYNGSLKLTEEMTTKLTSGGTLGALASIFSGSGEDSKRLTLPLKVSGTTSDPKYEVDVNALTKNAGQNLIKDAGSALEGLFKKKKN